jgi:hypothetical protein
MRKKCLIYAIGIEDNALRRESQHTISIHIGGEREPPK